ncbi:hypothetical protein DPMN_164947 [Dreissena polymorpha]|uniref:WxxW domain-containing protein n=2 Tax=Dreissena polymorpha TaxID=45954 RepID=A0A9D4EUH9_DREPO|nr:hypothetical protein DPMN_164947 [Dreissena polymorpha]
METRCVFLVLVVFGIYLYSSDAAICGWDSVWYNNSTPSAANNLTDTEVLPDARILDSICDKSAGGMLQVRCQTGGNMPFQFVLNDTSLQYFVSCIPINGLICKPWEGVTGASCPDFSIQLGCECPSTIAHATNPGVASTTQIGVFPGASPIGLFSTGITQRYGFSTDGIGQTNKGTMSGAGNASGVGNGSGTANISDSGQTSGTGHNSGTGSTGETGYTVGVGSGVVTGNTDSNGNRYGTGTSNETTGGKGNAGGNGNESGSTGSGKGTGSSGNQSGSGSLDGNSKSLNSWDRNGSVRREKNIIVAWTFVLLTFFSYNM